MEFETIIYEKKDNIAKITMNRPKVYNAVNLRMMKDLVAAFEDVELDRSVGVLVITGAGDKAFNTGGDINEFRDSDVNNARVVVSQCLKIAALMRDMGKPIIAAVNGWCTGWGLELCVFCDLVIAEEHAIFSQTELMVGSSPMFGATEIFPRLIGERKAREAIFLAKRFSAKEAEEIGLINKVVPDGKLMEAVDEWCQRILDMSPQSVRFAKNSMNSESGLLQSVLIHCLNQWTLFHESPEWKEGMSAFLEKRKPDFRQFRK